MGHNPEAELDEVLATLRGLIVRSSIPIVRVCLEDTYNDIAHLTDREGLDNQSLDAA